MSNLSVRTFSKEDRTAVLDIIQKTKNFNEMDKDVAVELVDHYLDTDDGEYLIDCVLLENTIVGYVCYGEASLTIGTYEIYYIAVDNNCQGKGYGKFLMKNVEERLKKNGARMILIETSSDDTYISTQKFYEKLGYNEVVRIKDFYKIGEDKVLYEKRF